MDYILKIHDLKDRLNEFRQKIHTYQIANNIDLDEFNHPVYGQNFLMYIFLTYGDKLLDDLGIPPMIIYYSKLYYFYSFKIQKEKIHNQDLGLSSYLNKLLEYAPDIIDWAYVENLFESIENSPKNSELE